MKGESAEVREQVRWLRGWDAAEYAADCHFCGALSKKASPFLGCAVPAKKAEPVRACHGLFLLPPQAVFAFVGDTRGAIINDVMFLRGVKGVCFKENPIG